MSNDSHGPSVFKRIGELVLYGIFIFVDAIEIWPHSRLAAVVLAFVGLVALLAIDGGFSRSQNTMFIGSAAIICAIAYFLVPETHHPDVEVTGTLHAADDPMPPDKCQVGKGDLAVFLGSNVAVRPQVGKFAIVTRGQTPLVSIEKTAEGVYVDALIFNAAGSLVGRVTKNEFHVLTGDNSYIERRGDLSTFGVYDKAGTELLFVRFINPLALRIRGIFYLQGRPAATITDTFARDGGITITDSCFAGGNVMAFQ